jgi:hypothetical protein
MDTDIMDTTITDMTTDTTVALRFTLPMQELMVAQ